MEIKKDKKKNCNENHLNIDGAFDKEAFGHKIQLSENKHYAEYLYLEFKNKKVTNDHSWNNDLSFQSSYSLDGSQLNSSITSFVEYRMFSNRIL